MKGLLFSVIAGMLAAGAPPTLASTAASATRDPRNSPTVTQLIVDRYQIAGEVVTLRVYAKHSDYFNCHYAGEQHRLIAFSLMGGPLETLTGYISRDLGRVLDQELAEQPANDPWLPITVRIRFAPGKLSVLCPDQVEILKWSRGWRYPPGSLSVERPDPAAQPTEKELRAVRDQKTWRLLTGHGPRHGRRADPIHGAAQLIGKTITLTGGATLSTLYDCAFRGAMRGYYAIRLHDDRATILGAYIPRGAAARRLVDYLALHRDVMLTVQGRVVQQRPSNYCWPQIEVTGWSFPRSDGHGPGR